MSDQYNPQQPYTSGYSPAPGAVQQDPGQTLGIVSLIASIASFFIVPLIGSIAGIICGKMARTKSREAGLEDNALGKWGFIIGIISLILSVIGVIIGVIFFVVVLTAGAGGSTY